jgi:hypothetical protein
MVFGLLKGNPQVGRLPLSGIVPVEEILKPGVVHNMPMASKQRIRD